MSDTANPGPEVLYEIIDNHIAVLTLNRPRVRNAVNGAMTALLEQLVRGVETDDRIRVAILTSSDGRAFCAGADLSEIAAGRGDLLKTPEGGFGGFVHAPRHKPWIAAVEGLAIGGGCELALACDMIVAAQNAQFGLPEVKRGLLAGAGGLFRLPRALPRSIALEMIATGAPMSAERAAAFGLLNRVVPPGTARDAAIDLARSIAENAPLAVRHSLAVARQAVDHSDMELRDISMAEVETVMASEDAKEGARAFLEKRRPQWAGR